MLQTKWIPQYDDDPQSWHRFLEKAAKGSCKAWEMLNSVDMAYMVKITDDSTAPETLSLADYNGIFRDSFPKACPFSSVAEAVEIGVHRGWFPHRFPAANRPHHWVSRYQNLWKRGSSVEWPVLAHDAIHLVHDSWSPDHCRASLGGDSLDYNSLLVVAGMLYFSLIWPDVPREG